jgi:hypothetical protein
MIEGQRSEATMARKKINTKVAIPAIDIKLISVGLLGQRNPLLRPTSCTTERSVAKEIRELAAKYEASRPKDKYHCEKIGIILKEVEDGTGDWTTTLNTQLFFALFTES